MGLDLAGLLQSVVSIDEGRPPRSIVWRGRRLRGALLAADLTAMALAVGVTGEYGGSGLHAWWFVLVVAVFPLAQMLGLYDGDELRLHKSTLDEVPGLFNLAVLITLAGWILSGVLPGAQLQGDDGLLLIAVLLVLLTLCRGAARARVLQVIPPERCVLIGDEETYLRLSRKLAGRHHDHARLVAHLPLDEPGGLQSTQLFGALDHLQRLIEEHDVHRLIIAPTVTEAAAVLELIRMAKALGVQVSLVPRMLEVVGSSVVFDSLEGTPVLGLRRLGLTAGEERIKRAFDIVVGLLLLALALPMLLVIAVAVRVDSAGPLLFRQERIGRGGRRFKLLKFRTMAADAEAQKEGLRALNEAEGLFKIAADPRVTRAGRFLRRASLDELPQLLNVVRGDMSLVGPRPLIAEEDAKISGWQRRRLDLTPGMTGQWQILGSARIPLPEMVKIDYLYVAGWSLWTDVKIMLRTLPYMVERRGQ